MPSSEQSRRDDYYFLSKAPVRMEAKNSENGNENIVKTKDKKMDKEKVTKISATETTSSNCLKTFKTSPQKTIASPQKQQNNLLKMKTKY